MNADRWQKYVHSRKTMNEIVIPAFDKAGIIDEVKNLTICGKFVYAAECCSCSTKHFKGYNKCRSRWCINCNHVRALAWVARLLPVLKEQMDRGNHITLMNLTVKDMPRGQLKKQIEGLQKAWRLMLDGNGTRKIFKERYPGGIRSLEVKQGKNSKQWHGHYHALGVQYTFAKDYDWISERWKMATSKVFGVNGSVWLHGIDKKNSLLKAVIECLKYIMKPELEIYTDQELLREAWSTLKGKRQINTWGILRGLAKQVEKDILEQDEKKLTDFICQYCGCNEAELKVLMWTELQDVNLLDYNSKKE